MIVAHVMRIPCRRDSPAARGGRCVDSGVGHSGSGGDSPPPADTARRRYGGTHEDEQRGRSCLQTVRQDNLQPENDTRGRPAMSSDPIAPDDEMALAEKLPQADASSLVDRDLLEGQVQEMYRQVAREEEARAPLRSRAPACASCRVSGRAARRDSGRGARVIRWRRLPPRPRRARPRRAGARSRLGLRNGRVLRRPPGRRLRSRGRSRLHRRAARQGNAIYEIATGSRRPSSSKRASMLSRSRTPASTRSSRTA